MNLAQLNAQARAIRQKPIGSDTRAQLDALRESADPGALAAFDTTLRSLFADVYGGKAPPPLSVTSGGPASNAANGGTRNGVVISFKGARDPTAIVAAVAAKVPALRTTTPTPMPIEAQFKPLNASERIAARTALAEELAALPVSGGSLLHKLEHSGLPAERLLDVLAQVKLGYERVSEATGDKPPGYQDVNWKHTRLEVDRVLDAVDFARLSPRDAEVALYASFLSDAVKAPSNFLVHNVHGAQAALHVLSRLVPPPSTDMIEDVVKATLEHQIGPPGFMANVALKNALLSAKVDADVVAGIVKKVAAPFDPASLTADRTQIAFTDVEKEALAKLGVFAWTVPHEGSRHYGAARAVIDGDSLVNYACPDGWAKLAAITGPDQPVFLQNPRFIDGLVQQIPGKASALTSFHDARNVVSATSLPLYDKGLARTQAALGRVMTALSTWAEAQPDVPRTKDGKVPYLDGALDYGDSAQLAFARRLRDEGVRLLRAEEAR